MARKGLQLRGIIADNEVMSIVVPTISTSLFEQLTHDLAEIYDSHHVCMVAAQTLARTTQHTAIVILRSPYKEHYDVWCASSDGVMEQLIWRDEMSVLNRPLTGSAVVQLNSADLVLSPIATRGSTLTLAPFNKTRYGSTPAGAIGLLDLQITIPLQSAAHFVTIYLERAVLRYRSTQQEIVFDVVNEITLSLTSTLSLEEIFDEVSNPVRQILNVESVSIGLYDNEKNELVFIKDLMESFFQDYPEVRLKAGQGIAGWVLANKEPLMINNVYADQRFYSEIDAASGFVTNSILAVPLMVEGTVVGVVEAINKQVGRFDNSDLDLMRAIASPLAIALENAGLHNEVLAEKRRIETIFDNMSEGLLTTDALGNITTVNDSMTALLQKERSDLIGRPLQKLLQARRGNITTFIEQVLTAVDDTDGLACDVYTDYSSDAVPVLISAANIKDPSGRISEAIFVFSDLREIREVERMRDDFFHNIVHELRTPLATILLYARLLRKGVKNPEKAERFFDTIVDESDRLQAMVRQMLSLAKMEANETQRSTNRVETQSLFQEIVPPLHDAATAKGLGFITQIAAPLPSVYGDRDMLYSIFKNLIDNAIKFTPTGSVSVSAKRDGDMLQVEVADEGIGISADGQKNLFRRFYRTKTAVEHGIAGTGLGLYMVKEGVEKHQGTLTVSSTLGQGTQFTVRLPVIDL